MFNIQSVPPKYKYAQALECSFNFFIQVVSQGLEDLLCSFFSAKEQQSPNIQRASQTLNIFLNISSGKVFHASVT